MKKGIAFFDFDGTITTRDSFIEFIRFCKGSFRLYLGLLLNSPYLIGFKIKLVSRQTAKERVLSYFFRNMPAGEFKECCDLFTSRALPGLIRPGALEEIRKLQQKGTLVVVVSASAENWIQNWTNQFGLELIASHLEINGGRITGRLIGFNCRGKEKVNRILERYPVAQFAEVYAYGDSSGDREMLKLAQFAYYKPFRGKEK
ncbi:MAG: HAD-IB family hydrolase [Flavisolibacter sp.]